MSELLEALPERDTGLVAEALPRRADVGKAVTDVAHAVFAGDLRLDPLLAQRHRELGRDIVHGVAPAATDIDRAANGVRGVERPHAGARNVMDGHEIPPLAAVLEDQ